MQLVTAYLTQLPVDVRTGKSIGKFPGMSLISVEEDPPGVVVVVFRDREVSRIATVDVRDRPGFQLHDPNSYIETICESIDIAIDGWIAPYD